MKFTEYLKAINSVETGKHNKKISIALVANSTIQGLKEVITVVCDQAKIEATITVTPYNQLYQQALDPNSELRTTPFDLIILFDDTRSLLGDNLFSGKEPPEPRLIDAIKSLKKHTTSTILAHNYELPTHTALGIQESKQLGIRTQISELNQKLHDTYEKDARVFIVDYELFLSDVGKRFAFDHKMYYRADTKLSTECYEALAQHYLAYIVAVTHTTKKCLVLDLDNTLWGGIVGEDGVNGITLGPTPQGRPFLELQHYILSLYERGIILAINSKNNETDVEEVWNNHPHMILQKKHFGAIQINWDDKAINITRLAKQLNIGIDSMVFVDDDKINCALVSEQLPDVTVVDLPTEPESYVDTIQRLPWFNSLQLTAEDKKRGKSYSEQRERQEFAQTTDLNSFLKGLQTTVTLAYATESTISRVAQLTNKTNQFNMTTKRYSEQEITQMSKNSDYLIITCSAKDKFGDQGLIGVAIISKKPKWEVDTFLLSCRVIGRGIEDVLLNAVRDAAHNEGVTELHTSFVETAKNAVAKDFYTKQGSTNNVLKVKTEKNPEHITVIWKTSKKL